MDDTLRVIDTSVLVRYLVGDDLDKQHRAKAVVDSGIPIGITSVALMETAYVLQRVYGYNRLTIVDGLVEFLTRRNVVGVGIDKEHAAARLLLCRQSGTVSFGDALLAATASSVGLDEAYSFDEKLSRSGLVVVLP
ncbi:MAG: PIN domain-containing protein [Chloroflexi bacterium]|nr:PIN domain-containing protein [Chloroflexota bacterium]